LVRNNGSVVDEQILENTNAYLSAYVMIVFAVFAAISLDGFSTGTNFSAVLACFNNIGPGLSAVGPLSNYALYTDFTKIILSFAMLFGRLEIYPLLIALTPSTWTKK